MSGKHRTTKTRIQKNDTTPHQIDCGAHDLSIYHFLCGFEYVRYWCCVRYQKLFSNFNCVNNGCDSFVIIICVTHSIRAKKCLSRQILFARKPIHGFFTFSFFFFWFFVTKWRILQTIMMMPMIMIIMRRWRWWWQQRQMISMMHVYIVYITMFAHFTASHEKYTEARKSEEKITLQTFYHSRQSLWNCRAHQKEKRNVRSIE